MNNEPPQPLWVDQAFFQQYPLARALLELFELLPRTVFYAKDRQSRFVAGNAAMVSAKNLNHPHEFLGRSDRDFHPPVLAEAYIREDNQVMQTGQAVANELWFVMDSRGRPGWYSSSKVPLHDGQQVVGIAGIRYPVNAPQQMDQAFRRLAPAIRWLEKHFSETISMAKLAEQAGLSTTHLNRQFKQLLRMSPTRFLHAMRIDKARMLLETTEQSLSEIALSTGYWDQSHFTRYFTKLTGVSPRRYRRLFRRPDRPRGAP